MRIDSSSHYCSGFQLEKHLEVPVLAMHPGRCSGFPPEKCHGVVQLVVDGSTQT